MSESKKELFRSLKFLLFSISAGVIQIGSFTIFSELFQWKEWIGHLIALILSVIWNFTLNRKFTFKSAGNIPVAMVKVALFYAVFTPLSTYGTALLTEEAYAIMWNGYVVELLMMVINFVTEYFYDRYIVFGKSLDTAK